MEFVHIKEAIEESLEFIDRSGLPTGFIDLDILSFIDILKSRKKKWKKKMKKI
jgi:predicted AAA+ superfamily ATPase